MYAIAFDLVVADLKEYYGEPYNNAYFEIKMVPLPRWTCCPSSFFI